MEAPEFVLHHSPELNLVELAVRQVPADTFMLETRRGRHASPQSETETGRGQGARESEGEGATKDRQTDTLANTLTSKAVSTFVIGSSTPAT